MIIKCPRINIRAYFYSQIGCYLLSLKYFLVNYRLEENVVFKKLTFKNVYTAYGYDVWCFVIPLYNIRGKITEW